MTERELYLKKTGEIIERLRERGIVPPAMPQADGQEMILCPVCKGEETKIHCQECGGSGYKVKNPLFEWARTVQGMIHG